MINILINKLKSLIRKNFTIYDLAVKFILACKGHKFKILFYNTKRDLIYNIAILEKLGLKINYNYINKHENFRQKFHIKIFNTLKNNLKDENIKILEIGTYDGSFAKYLSEVFINSKIYTIDLKKDDPRFISSYKRNSDEYLKKFLNIRKKNLSQKNIEFIEMDSINLKDRFDENYFDIIWVDGDHRDPMATKDIFNSYDLIKKDGYVVIDDISQIRYAYESNLLVGERANLDYLNALVNLKKEKKVEFYLFNQMVRPENYFLRSNIGLFRK